MQSDPSALVVVVSDRDDPAKTHVLDAWQSYSIVDDLEQGVPHFEAELAATPANRKMIGPGGQRCYVFEDGAFQFSGILDERSEDCSLTAADLKVTGRGVCGLLQDCDIAPGDLSLAGLTFEQLAKKWIAPYSEWIPGVTVNAAAARYIAAGGGGSSGGGGGVGGRPIRRRVLGTTLLFEPGTMTGPAKPFGKASPYYRGIDREPLRQTSMELGTKIWDGLKKIAEQIGAHVWSACDGTLILGRPSYDCDPVACYGAGLRLEYDPAGERYVTTSGAIQGIRFESTCAERASEYLLVGTSKPNKKAKGASVVKNWASVKDPSPAFWRRQATPPYLTTELLHRPRCLDVKSLLDPKLIRRIAQRTMEEAAIKGLCLEIKVGGHHGPAGVLWTTDTMVDLHDERHDLYGPHYIIRREFNFDSKGDNPAGRTAKLKLIPPDVWLPSFDPDAISADAYTQHMMHRIWW